MSLAAAAPSASVAARAVSLGSFVLVVTLGGAQGGYFPESWGWFVVALAAVVVLTLIVVGRIPFGRLEACFLASVLGLSGLAALSITWSADVEQSVLEVQRGMIYLVGALAATLVVRRSSVSHLLAGLLAGIVWLCAQALASRLFPPAGPGYEVISLGRLAEPVGYFNALGLLAVMGTLLALGFAVHGRRRSGRAAAAASLPILLTAAYFTYSRGAALALAIALVAAVAVDRRRLVLLTAGLLVALPSVAAVWIASGAPGLTSVSAPRALIDEEGRHLAIVLLVLATASAAIAAGLAALEPRVQVSPPARRAYVTALGCIAAVLVAVAVIGEGGPSAVARSTYDAISTPPTTTAGEGQNLNRRLGSVSSVERVDGWRVAWREFEQHPWAGSGAGTYEQFWLRYRQTGFQARDAHSLYLETLGQLGWPGLAFVIGLLAFPVAGGLRARDHPLVAVAVGASVAYIIHTGIDWDWEMPIVTLLALLCGVALIAARGESAAQRAIRPAWRVVGALATAAVAAFSMVGLVGNQALAAAAEAVDSGDFRTGAAEARIAMRWAPWSAEAHQQLGRAQAGLGQRARGRASLRTAARKSSGDWRIWYDLGVVSSGPQRQRAFAHAARLNPLEPDIEVLRERGYRLPVGETRG